MSAETSIEEQAGALRPLPSVNMALLPEHRRAQRIRRAIALGLFLALFGGTALAWLWTNHGQDALTWAQGRYATLTGNPTPNAPQQTAATVGASIEPDTPEEVASPPATLLAEAPPLRQQPHYETEFGNANSFHAALINAGLDPEESKQIEDALRHVIDFRRCQKTHRLVIDRSTEGELIRFEYHPAATEFAEVVRDQTGAFKASHVKMAIERTAIARAGTIDISLGDALEKAGLPAGLATYFVEALERRINFATDPRKGDVFRVVVDEERVDGRLLRYGRVRALEYQGHRSGRLRAYYFAPPQETGEFYDETGHATQGGWLRTPLRYDRISSRFNPRRVHPILKRIVPHLGVDYAASIGTPVWAAASGVVRFAGRRGVNGNLVTIRHADGYETSYAHLHRIRRGLRPGDRVYQHELIGVVGSTGRSTGPHLHFSLKRYKRPIDPLEVLNGPGQRLSKKHQARFQRTRAALQAQLDGIVGAPTLIADSNAPAMPAPDEALD